MRGKDVISGYNSVTIAGSPPRAREGLKSKFTDHMKNGITPACAGRTLSLSSFTKSDWDHPRVRGKDELQEIKQKKEAGSPPRAREGH